MMTGASVPGQPCFAALWFQNRAPESERPLRDEGWHALQCAYEARDPLCREVLAGMACSAFQATLGLGRLHGDPEEQAFLLALGLLMWRDRMRQVGEA